jgi:flagellar hook-associated protein 2
VPAALVIAAGVNDTLQLQVDGVAATVTLAAGSYTAASLAATLQARINGTSALAAAGASVTIVAAGGVLTVNSGRYGAASSVAISGGNAAVDLFGAAVSTAGVDAQGSLGGKAATGAGRFLTAQGLTVEVEGGATGARGSLTYTRGYGDQLNTLIGDLMDSTIATRTNGLNASSKAIDRQREMLNSRLDNVEKRYRAQFIALDNMVATMNSTSSYLTQQLAALPKIGS